MPYGTLLLHLDDSAHCDARIDLTIHLAGTFGSHVVGLAASGRTPFAESAGAGFLRRDDLASALAATRRLAEARAQHFDERMRASTAAASHEAIVDDDDDAPALVRHGLCADLVILGQPDPSEPDHARARSQFELALLHGAPPALVLPHVAAQATAGRRILVAWNGTRECARAAAAARPLLQKAEEVRILQCETPLDAIDAAQAPGIDRARDWLARNGVLADARLLPAGIDAGGALIAHAHEMGADLVVMGAWGRMRWSERLFGGATRTMLASTNVALLLAR